MIDPVSALSGTTPVEKASDHLFFQLSQFQDLLADWVSGDQLQHPSRTSFVSGLMQVFRIGTYHATHPTLASRFPVTQKYFYVWLDAPIGYIASHQNLCDRTGEDFDSYWQPGADTELYHFIGKDIINFHGLFWPAMLASAGLRQPSAIFAHGFLTVDGTKMSKSRGTFIMASTYLEHLDAEYLRYYFAAKLSSSVDDMDLNLEDFVQRVNSDLVGKVVNIASRCAGFLRKRFDNQLSETCSEPELLTT